MGSNDDGNRMSGEQFRRTIAEARAEGVSGDELCRLFELDADELAAIEAGNDALWLAKQTGGYGARVSGLSRALSLGQERKGRGARARAVMLGRLAELMEVRGVPEGMSVDDAVTNGLILESELVVILDPNGLDVGTLFPDTGPERLGRMWTGDGETWIPDAAFLGDSAVRRSCLTWELAEVAVALERTRQEPEFEAIRRALEEVAGACGVADEVREIVWRKQVDDQLEYT